MSSSVVIRPSTDVGYACANHFRPRLAYRFCVDDSVYLADGAIGRGFGKLLLVELGAAQTAPT